MRKTIVKIISIAISVIGIIILSLFVKADNDIKLTSKFQDAYPEERPTYTPAKDEYVSEYMVEVFSYNDEGEHFGSGILVKKTNDKNYILTNRHIIENMNRINCHYYNEAVYDATVEYISDKHDLAVISTFSTPFSSPIPISLTPLKVNEKIRQEGNFEGQGITTTFGEVVKNDATPSGLLYEKYEFVMVNAYTSYGCSGGAITDREGNLRGINFEINTVKNLDFVLPITSVYEEIKEYLEMEERW